jgi:hypothetical protein
LLSGRGSIAGIESPYLQENSRLSDVIAAIQAAATYKFYKLDFEGWADRISADITRAEHWRRVFEQHPEFFRLDGERKKGSLVWRRQYPKRYDVDNLVEMPKADYDRLSSEQKARVSRTPLKADDIKTLIGTAIDLHSRALEARKERNWYKPLTFQAIAGLLGAALGAWASYYFKPVDAHSIPAPTVQARPAVTPQGK